MQDVPNFEVFNLLEKVCKLLLLFLADSQLNSRMIHAWINILGNYHHQIDQALDELTLRTVTFEGIDVTLDAGYSKPISAITLDGKQELMDTLKLHYTLYRNKAVLDQLKSRPDAPGVLNVMMKHPQICEPFFVSGLQAPLTAGKSKFHSTVLHAWCEYEFPLITIKCRHDQEFDWHCPLVWCWRNRKGQRRGHFSWICSMNVKV